MKSKLSFIDIVEPKSNRVSSFAIGYNGYSPGELRLSGGLDHRTTISPRTIKDAEKIIQVMTDFISDRTTRVDILAKFLNSEGRVNE